MSATLTFQLGRSSVNEKSLEIVALVQRDCAGKRFGRDVGGVAAVFTSSRTKRCSISVGTRASAPAESGPVVGWVVAGFGDVSYQPTSISHIRQNTFR